MASTYAKGNQYELEVKKILESQGWIPEGQHRKVSYIPDYKHPNPATGKPTLRLIMMGRDVYGCDIIAKRAGHKPLWIQVSTRANKSHKISQVLQYPWNYEHETLQLWLRTEGKREYEIFEGPDFGSVGIVKAV
jgi:hypothetical protein